MKTILYSKICATAAALGIAAMFTVSMPGSVNAAPGGNGNGNAWGLGKNGGGGGGGGGGPLPVLGATLLGQSAGAAGLCALWWRRRRRKQQTQKADA